MAWRALDMLFIIEGFKMHRMHARHNRQSQRVHIAPSNLQAPFATSSKHTQDTRHQSSPTASTTSHGPHDGVSTVSRMQKVHAPPIKQFRQHEASHRTVVDELAVPAG